MKQEVSTMASLFRGRGQPGSKPDTTRHTKSETQLLPETLWAQDPMPNGIPPENTVVVTISRQFGSGGAEIGRLVARDAGLQYLDHEIITRVAARSGMDIKDALQQDEQTTGITGHLLEAIQASNPFTVNYNTLITPTSPSMLTQSRELAYLRLTQRVILELASQGNAVIIGRGAQFLLRGATRTLHISIFAPLTDRITNVMHHFQMTHAQARRLIEQRDYEQERYLRHYYGTNGQQPELYHLLINTGLFSFEQAADLIRQALPVIQAID